MFFNGKLTKLRVKRDFGSRNHGLRDYNGVMEMMKQITVRGIRQRSADFAGEWIASEVESGYTLRCGEVVLFTVNSGKPRVFRSLDAVKQTLQQEMGITEFKVETLKAH